MTSTAVLLVASCNAAVGGGVVALMGGAGFLAGQCYDRVRVRVRDPHTGLPTCSADVTVSEAGGSERRLRPCYSAALTEGSWTLTARQEGYAPVTMELVVPDHEGACPHYTHTIELTLRREGEPAGPPPPATRTASEPTPSAPTTTPGAATDLESPPARIVPPPIPGSPSSPAGPVVPTRSFEPLPAAPPTAPDAGTPR
jgi:hypothetical protein